MLTNWLLKSILSFRFTVSEKRNIFFMIVRDQLFFVKEPFCLHKTLQIHFLRKRGISSSHLNMICIKARRTSIYVNAMHTIALEFCNFTLGQKNNAALLYFFLSVAVCCW